jgi:hypothetical protein
LDALQHSLCSSDGESGHLILGAKMVTFKPYLAVAAILVCLVVAPMLWSQTTDSAATPDNLKAELRDLKSQLQKARNESAQQVAWLSRTSPPVGTVSAFGGPWPPAKGEGGTWTEDEIGWLLADGRSLDPVKHKELIAVLQSQSLPNYCGVFLRGIDTKSDGSAAGRDPGARRAPNDIQDWATGMPRNRLTTTANGGFDFNDRVITGPNIDDARLNRWPLFGRGQAGLTPALSDFRAPSKNGRPISQPDHTHTINGGDSETRPVNAAISWLIKFK